MSFEVRAVKRAILACSVVATAFLWGPLLLGSRGADQERASGAAVLSHAFVGMTVCAECHTEIADSHEKSGMRRALDLPQTARILVEHPRLKGRSGPFVYQIVRQGMQRIYSVTDGVNTLSAPILYAFGTGKAGQTYVYEHDGQYYESRMSYYADIDGLDVTIGHTPPGKVSLVEALGRLVSGAEMRDCIDCHSTAGVVNKALQLDRVEFGVNCEACHGPGRDHVAAMKAGDFKNPRITNPNTLDGDTLSQELCGKCHRSAETVLMMPGGPGLNGVRFQPYRIFTSKCYSDDRRISCVACHDPHSSLETKVAFYDAKCLACHAPNAARPVALAGKRLEPPCPVAAKDCVTCHMPKVDLPGAHMAFTDHRIRIAKPGEPYPN